MQFLLMDHAQVPKIMAVLGKSKEKDTQKVSWPRGAPKTMPYPDINLDGLGVDWAWRTAP